MDMAPQYVIGIDLGTTNSVLAYSDLAADEPTTQRLAIPQLVAPGTVESHSALPSFLHLAIPEEVQGGAYDLPWQSGLDFAVGQLARRQAAEVPDRTVVAAKSWLCHHRVDRHQAILPWQSPASVAKISPITASQRYLEHLVAAWEAAFPDAPAGQQRDVPKQGHFHQRSGRPGHAFDEQHADRPGRTNHGGGPVVFGERVAYADDRCR